MLLLGLRVADDVGRRAGRHGDLGGVVVPAAPREDQRGDGDEAGAAHAVQILPQWDRMNFLKKILTLVQ